MQIKDPLRIEVLRGGFQESLHLVHAVVTDSSGKVVEGWGDIDFLTFPRSAVKPLQAIPLILSGAEERFQMSTARVSDGLFLMVPNQLTYGWFPLVGTYWL